MPIWPGLAKVLIRTGIAQQIPSIQRVMGDGLPYLKYYNRRILGSPNVELKATQAMLDGIGEDVIDLTSGAPVFRYRRPIPAPSDMGYPPVAGILPLREAIAEKLERDNGVSVDPEHQILVCNGVSQAIGLVLDTFVEPRGRIAVLDPSFFLYRLAAQNREMRVVHIPTRLKDGYVTLRDGDLKKALRKSTILFVNSPCNPTGGILSESTMDRITYWCRRYDVLLFADEVYERFVYDGRHCSIASLPEARNRTITANSFSKSYGMAGSRVGYVAGPRHLIQPMIVSYLASAPFVSTASQQEALRVLQGGQSWFSAELELLRNRRDRIASHLSAVGVDYEFPHGAFFFWVNVRRFGTDGASFATRLLEEQRVLVMRGESCGPSGRDHVRISFAGEDSQIREGMIRLGCHIAERYGGSPGNAHLWPAPAILRAA